MKSFTLHTGIVMPLDRSNVDTDMIIPKQFMKSIARTGFGKNLFDGLRYLDVGEPDQPCDDRPINPDFPINFPRYANASILLTRDNFGCGSSREHAPWALADFGFKVIVASSFADIFHNNALKNGILPVCLSAAEIDQLFEAVNDSPGYQLSVDLERQVVETPCGTEYGFQVDAFRRRCLLEGLDDIDLTLKDAELIAAFESNRQAVSPWIFEKLTVTASAQSAVETGVSPEAEQVGEMA